MAQTLLEGEAEVLTRKAIKLAGGGNVMLLKFFLERLLPPPPRNQEDDPVDLETVIALFEAGLAESRPPELPKPPVIEVNPNE